MSSSLLSSQGGSTGTIRAKRAGEGESRGSSSRFSISFLCFFVFAPVSLDGYFERNIVNEIYNHYDDYGYIEHAGFYGRGIALFVTLLTLICCS